MVVIRPKAVWSKMVESIESIEALDTFDGCSGRSQRLWGIATSIEGRLRSRRCIVMQIPE